MSLTQQITDNVRITLNDQLGSYSAIRFSRSRTDARKWSVMWDWLILGHKWVSSDQADSKMGRNVLDFRTDAL